MFKFRYCDVSSSVLFDQDNFGSSGSFVVSCERIVSLLASVGTASGTWVGISIASVGYFRSEGYFNKNSSDLLNMGWVIFPCLSKNLFDQCFMVFNVLVFHLFD